MNLSPRRIPWTALVTAVILVAIFEYLFFLPLRPTAWGGPRDTGPFEERESSAVGRWSRDAQLHLESLAKWRSPNRPLAATAETFAGFHALLTAARFGILWLILRRLTGHGCLAAVATGLAVLPIVLGSPRQTDADVGLVFFVLLLGITSPSRPSWWSIVICIPVLFAIWANAHASVVIGLAWIGIVIVGRVIEWWKGYLGDEAERPAVVRLWLASVLAAGAACITPQGPNYFVDAFASAKNTNFFALNEWQPIDFSAASGMPWVYFASIALLFVAQLLTPRPLSPLALVVILSFGIWPLVQQRGSDYWWMLAAWLLAPQVSSAIARWRSPISNPSAEFTAGAQGGGTAFAESDDSDLNLQASSPHPALYPQSEGKSWAIVWVVVVVAAVLATPAARWFITGSPRSLEKVVSRDTPALLSLELTASGDEQGRFMPELREELRLAYPSGNYRGAILGGLEQGDFLAWVLEDDKVNPVMIYSRPQTFDEPHWEECISALRGESPWWEILGRHQVNLIAINPSRHSKLADRLRASEEWRTVQDDGRGGLLISIRREPKLPVELMGP